MPEVGRGRCDGVGPPVWEGKALQGEKRRSVGAFLQEKEKIEELCCFRPYAELQLWCGVVSTSSNFLARFQ